MTFFEVLDLEHERTLVREEFAPIRDQLRDGLVHYRLFQEVGIAEDANHVFGEELVFHFNPILSIFPRIAFCDFCNAKAMSLTGILRRTASLMYASCLGV